MTETIPNLWPTEFRVDVQSPLTILKVQAGLLSKVTRGILQGTVETETGKDRVQHRLVVVAPAYNSYRHTLLTAIHDINLPYPVEVRAEALAQRGHRENTAVTTFGGLDLETVYPNALDDENMKDLVRRALQSGPTRATILSLISKSNEARETPSAVTEKEGVEKGNGE